MAYCSASLYGHYQYILLLNGVGNRNTGNGKSTAKSRGNVKGFQMPGQWSVVSGHFAGQWSVFCVVHIIH